MTAMPPNFLFIGPDKTGSSWLYELLRHHPQCYVPESKDIYFFDRYYERGLEWYFTFFKPAARDAKAVGELSHDYLFSAAVADRIARDLPGVRLLTCLRNPVERTFSHYLYLLRSGHPALPFDEALDAYPELINNSLYHRHLSVYFERFQREHIQVLFFDDLKRDSTAFAMQVFDFLGVERRPDLVPGQVVRAATYARSRWLARLAKSGATLARDLGFPNLVGKIKHGRLAQLLYRGYAPHTKPVMDDKSRARLQALFAPDIAQLELLLNTKLGHWK
jgi:Sulfotransferase domain